jgi:hypothetical protein
VPATVLAALPPTSRLPTRFRPPPLARGQLDPVSTCYSPMDQPGQTPPVDFCNRNDPRATTAEPFEPRSPHPRSPACVTYASRALADPARSSWVTRLLRGRSAEVSPARDGHRNAVSAPPATIARRGSFTPTESARTPPVADPMRRRPGEPSSPALSRRLASPPDNRPLARTTAFQGRLSTSPAKGSPIRRTRGAFRRKTSPEGTDSLLHMLSPTCGLLESAPFLPSCAGAI